MRIVVVELHTSARSSLHALLESQGHDVSSFPGARTARIAARQLKEPTVVLFRALKDPKNSEDFLKLAEHEEYLLDIASQILSESRAEVLTEEVEEAPVSGVRLNADLVETHRAMQRAAAKRLAKAKPAVTESGEMPAVAVAAPFKRAANG